MTRLAALLLPILLSLSLSPATPSAAHLPKADCERETAAAQSPAAASTVLLVKAWIDAMNNLDDAAFIRFIQERGPILRDEPEQWLGLRNVLRTFQYCGVKSADAGTVELWMFDPNWDSYGIANFKLGATPADKITFVFLRPAGEVPADFPQPASLAPAQLVDAVRDRAASRAAADQFSGAVYLAQGDRVLFQQAYGLADRANNKPNTLDTQFRFGSMGKMFTAVAIMQLVQDGKLDLDAPIGRYLTDYPNPDVAAKVTVAHLLSHTGGTGDIFVPEFWANKATLRSLTDYVALFGKRPLGFAPGSRVAYSNYGFILLGRIVEQVSGLSYDDYIQRKIFAPAGMASTGNVPESTILPRRAISYMGPPDKLKPADDTLPFSGTAAGGGYSTVGDFNRFVRGLTSHRLLRADIFRKLVEGGVTMADGQFARFDFGGSMPGAGRYIGHGGGAPGMSGMLFHFLDSGFTLIVLANRDPGASESIAFFAAHRLPAK